MNRTKSMNNTKPILCNTQVTKNIMSGLQTQDRRPMRVQPVNMNGAPKKIDCYDFEDAKYVNTTKIKYAYGFETDDNQYKAPWQVGDLLWVRERARLVDVKWHRQNNKESCLFEYEADNTYSDWIFIPDRIKAIEVGNCCPNGCFKELARTWLKVTRVLVERVQDISEEDAYKEGIYYKHVPALYPTAKKGFEHLIESIYPGICNDNRWMWCREFEKVVK